MPRLKNNNPTKRKKHLGQFAVLIVSAFNKKESANICGFLINLNF